MSPASNLCDTYTYYALELLRPAAGAGACV